MKPREEMLAEFNEQKERMRREEALVSFIESALEANRRINAILITAASLALVSGVCSTIVAVKALVLAVAG